MEYLVKWVIQVEADSIEEAALEARRIQLDPESLATIFDVQDPETYLWEIVNTEEGQA